MFSAGRLLSLREGTIVEAIATIDAVIDPLATQPQQQRLENILASAALDRLTPTFGTDVSCRHCLMRERVFRGPWLALAPSGSSFWTLLRKSRASAAPGAAGRKTAVWDASISESL